ncbi:MAG: carboxypeptidase regulatory-like domain-containing protein [Gemmatimonadetes bacterium]|nr:carboxypeptidase regulatory-like domain-containing protein [Gemmatimonadota bacterium]
MDRLSTPRDGHSRVAGRGTARSLLLLSALAGAAGGAVATAQEDGRAAGTIFGVVYDSTAQAPLAGARVAVVGTSATSDTDEWGRYRIEGVPPGAQRLTFFHPRLGVLGVGAGETGVLVAAEEETEANLAVPSHETMLGIRCSVAGRGGDVSVGGTVTDEITGVPLPEARVAAAHRRKAGAPPRVVETRTDRTGRYLFCNLVSVLEPSLTAHFGTSESRPHRVGRPGPQIVDLRIRIADPVEISGTVLDHATRAPLPGARIRLLGTDRDLLADSAGRFALSGVAPGVHVIRTDHLGYASRTDSLTVFSREALGLEIHLAPQAVELAPLVVTGRRRAPEVYTTPGTRFSGLTEAQVDSVLPRVVDLASLLRASSTPGLSVRTVWVPDAHGLVREGLCVEVQRRRRGGTANACNMVDVRLNDGPVPEPIFFLKELNPQDVRWLQVINPIEAGFLYGDRGANGVLLLYSRSGGRQ